MTSVVDQPLIGELAEAAEAVGSRLSGAAPLGVAFSGGVDSSVLLALAVRALGADQVVAILGVSPSLASDERLAAHRVAEFIGARIVEIQTREGDNPAYRANGPDRCFHCKDELFTRIDDEVAEAYGLAAVAYGENADDMKRPDRPGSRAASNHQVLRPLADAGLDKAAVRAIARALRLRVPTSRRPRAWRPGFRTIRKSRRRSSRRSRRPRRRCASWASPSPECAITAMWLASSFPPVNWCEPSPRRRASRFRTLLPPPASGSSPSIWRAFSRAPSRCRCCRSRVREPWQPDEAMTAFIELDHDRARRRGYPEAVYCEGKTPSQVRAAAEAIKASGTTTLFTRASPAHAEAVLGVLPDARYDADARLLAWPPQPPASSGGRVLVVAAGTSDLAVAREAQLSAVYLGRTADLITDVGIAGLHRILARLDQLRSARAIVVVAGMDGALPGVVAGLVSAPVIAVPTSVGYGAAFGGVAALLTMLNSCAPGVAVVNIDNGYGAGHMAAQITAPA